MHLWEASDPGTMPPAQGTSLWIGHTDNTATVGCTDARPGVLLQVHAMFRPLPAQSLERAYNETYPGDRRGEKLENSDLFFW